MTAEERLRYYFRCASPTPLPVVQAATQPRNQMTVPTDRIADLKAQFEEAKAKCAELGFKANTEAFGKCVLELTK